MGTPCWQRKMKGKQESPRAEEESGAGGAGGGGSGGEGGGRSLVCLHKSPENLFCNLWAARLLSLDLNLKLWNLQRLPLPQLRWLCHPWEHSDVAGNGDLTVVGKPGG